MGDDLNPLRVQALFKRISGEDTRLLDLPWRPEDLLMTYVPVPPVCIRPSVEMDTGAGTNEDDLTIKLQARPLNCACVSESTRTDPTDSACIRLSVRRTWGGHRRGRPDHHAAGAPMAALDMVESPDRY